MEVQGVSACIILCILQSSILGSIPLLSTRNHGWVLPCLASPSSALTMVFYSLCLPEKWLLACFSQLELFGFCVQDQWVESGNLWATALWCNWLPFVGHTCCGFQFWSHQGPGSCFLNYARVISFCSDSLKCMTTPGFRGTPRFLSLKNINSIIFLSCFISPTNFFFSCS